VNSPHKQRPNYRRRAVIQHDNGTRDESRNGCLQTFDGNVGDASVRYIAFQRMRQPKDQVGGRRAGKQKFLWSGGSSKRCCVKGTSYQGVDNNRQNGPHNQNRSTGAQPSPIRRNSEGHETERGCGSAKEAVWGGNDAGKNQIRSGDRRECREKNIKQRIKPSRTGRSVKSLIKKKKKGGEQISSKTNRP